MLHKILIQRHKKMQRKSKHVPFTLFPQHKRKKLPYLGRRSTLSNQIDLKVKSTANRLAYKRNMPRENVTAKTIKRNNPFSRIPASGQKLTVGIKRPAHLGVMNKSQTLPRSMGSKAITNGAATHRQTPKPAATPPAIRRQFSVTIVALRFIVQQFAKEFFLSRFPGHRYAKAVQAEIHRHRDHERQLVVRQHPLVVS